MLSYTQRAARRLAERDGHTVLRPAGAAASGQGGGRSFPLTYVRTGPRTDTPVLVIPGGPGLASALPYKGLRSSATRRGLDVIMVEHRGVGLSRQDEEGEDLRVDDVTVEAAADDLAAVLDAEGVQRCLVYGSSYGTYLAQVFGVRHPERVSTLVLDSPMLSVEDDLAMTRAHRRRLLWDGGDGHAAAASLIRELADRGESPLGLSHVVQVVYEFAGLEVLTRLLTARLGGRLGTLWDNLARLGTGEVAGTGLRYFMEPDLVAGISYGELGYGLPPDGGPLDPQLLFAAVADEQPPFRGEPVDLREKIPDYLWPVVVISGARDLRTPPPVARRLADLAPHSRLIPIARMGHSALDVHQRAMLTVCEAVLHGTLDQVLAHPGALAALPRRGSSGYLGPILATVVRATTRTPTRDERAHTTGR